MFEDVDLRAVTAGFVGALLVLVGLVWFVGVDEVVYRLTRAPPGLVVLILLAAICWLTSWGLALRTVLDSLGFRISAVRSFFLFAAATFANNVTPFGQAGGEPVSALFISREADTEYETALAAIASVDGLNFVPSIGFALLAIGYYAVTIAFNDRLVFVASAVAGLAVALVAAAVLGWRHRYAIERRVVAWFAPVLGVITTKLPLVRPVSVESLEGRIEGFFDAIERVATDRNNLVSALSLSALGWAFSIASLTLSLSAVSSPAWPLLAASMLAIPIGSVAGVTPLPGGLGGIEAVLIFVLTPVTPLTGGAVTAAVLLHRAATYWFPLLLGGGSVAAFSTRS